jgi:putative FmdB family regulatory protein
MPLFEFRCRRCDHEYELLVRGREAVDCPECGASTVEKLQSATAAHVPGGMRLPLTSSCPPADAPPCRPGCCRLG